ncbi:universal stress protein [Halodesulfurarchaeum sp. HSR-GB]|uniref:universal stress protein n=1 Tax=Halodesulfurarchaeum sp. HSR-GB TaxID=3074077 RepID=UPI0028577CB2|nr:universal stress protein [Halodesulfurarchaeum sp. HSR-GB]MDR5657600.1 universal stress protein [Halodesulfurarchaeum sp. HSR-GB]
MRKILVPVDGSEHADAALAYAIERFSDAEITALHVVDLPQGYFAATAGDPEEIPSVEHRKEEAKELLEAVEAEAEQFGGHVDTDIATGDPADEILEYASAHDFDEIVIGSRGISGVGRIVFGSVAEKVVRRAEIPVVVVH